MWTLFEPSATEETWHEGKEKIAGNVRSRPKVIVADAERNVV